MRLDINHRKKVTQRVMRCQETCVQTYKNQKPNSLDTSDVVRDVVTSPFHSLTRILANKRRKLVLTPDYNSYWKAGLQTQLNGTSAAMRARHSRQQPASPAPCLALAAQGQKFAMMQAFLRSRANAIHLEVTDGREILN